MADNDKKGITVKVDAKLHAEVSRYLQGHGMTMSEFVAQALDNELHPKNQMKEGANMANTRTIAFQVPEEVFQRIKDYLQRNSMTQRQFLMGLIEDELAREQDEREAQEAAQTEEPDLSEEDSGQTEEGVADGFEANSDELDDDVEEDESEDFTMSM